MTQNAAHQQLMNFLGFPSSTLRPMRGTQPASHAQDAGCIPIVSSLSSALGRLSADLRLDSIFGFCHRVLRDSSSSSDRLDFGEGAAHVHEY